jgi:hypothetical protein
MGFLLMISGMAIVLAALVLFAGAPQRLAFVMTGIMIEAVGLLVLAAGYKSLQTTARQKRVTR